MGDLLALRPVHRRAGAAVRVMLEAKLPFAELGRRWSAAGWMHDPKHVFMLLEAELDEMAANPSGWADRLAERRGRTRARPQCRSPPR